MKFIRLYISVLVLGLSIQASANNNPLMRNCRLTGGEFYAVAMNGDTIGFCKYGVAMIDALSILQTTSSEYVSTASQLALGNGANCENHGQLLVYPDIENAEFFACRFPDGSWLEINTMHNGANSANNAGLVQALKTRF